MPFQKTIQRILTMKEKYKQNIFICCISLLLLLCIGFNSRLNASISSEMYAINAIDSLEQYYNESNEYSQRYILKYLPKWLNNKGVSSLPAWSYDAINNALMSEDAMLIREAIILVGEYKLEQHSDLLVELYQESHSKHPADADRIRSSTIESLMKIGGSKAKANLPLLLKFTPRYYLDSEFSILLSDLSEYGDSSCVSDLVLIENNLFEIISGVNQKEDPHRFYERYSSLLEMVKKLKNVLASKGGGDE